MLKHYFVIVISCLKMHGLVCERECVEVHVLLVCMSEQKKNKKSAREIAFKCPPTFVQNNISEIAQINYYYDTG